jgi:hypothetical protein
MRDTVHCRLSLVFAADVSITVILRRGPSRWVEAVKWNTADDSFEDGQWLHGRVYGERCGLSPDGKLFVYFAMKYGRIDKAHGYSNTFTAVSKPPDLTALAMWPEGSTWGGGGRFIDNKTLRLAYGQDRTSWPRDGRPGIYMAPMPPVHPDHQPTGLTIQSDLDYYDPDQRFRSSDVAEGVDRSGQDHRGRKVFVRAGALFRAEGSSEILIRQFDGDERRELVSPARARTW